MPKLKRFSKKSKMNYKNVSISLAILIGLMSVFGIYRSYAIYKLQQDYDVIKNKIGTFSMGDVRVAVLVDGEETDTFPSYETNYKVESIDCTNGVTATFDVENWQINIADMSATSTKCTVSFNSKETNEITPVNYTKSELVALNDEIKNTSAKELANYLYPVGSIYISTTISDVNDVVELFGGTWIEYGAGRTLIGAGTDDTIGTTYAVNAKGGTETTKISYTPSGNISNYSGDSGSTVLTVEQIPPHNHVIWTNIPKSDEAGSIQSLQVTTKWYNLDYGNLVKSRDTGGGQGHTHTMDHGHSFTGTEEKINVSTMQPYIVVYMYKRTA